MSDKLEIIADESIPEGEIHLKLGDKVIGKMVNFTINGDEVTVQPNQTLEEIKTKVIVSREWTFKPYPDDGNPEVFK